MQPTFERGDSQRPRGHALVYFRASDDPDAVLASYIVVPPITMDLAKYVPPMFAAQMSGLVPTGGLSVFPLPPFPERVESLELMQRLAAAREDDLLDGGTVNASDIQRMLMLVTEIAGEYGRLYTAYIERLPVEEPAAQALPSVDVDELLTSVMSDTEKVGRLAKLTGTVRYALEGGDAQLTAETVAEMERLGRHLGDQYRVADLVTAAQNRSPEAGKLAQLLLERCYKLAAEQYGDLQALDAEIDRLS